MYLKELTLRGFKSFASATTLRFEPGITAVVGPNGSGKSNIVDALTWVMGEQGAKNLRGTSMEDVIFAGTSSRPPLGRAQVSLTIDNTDHTLHIDYTEVTISRTIFRNGGSEYAINGSACRLLDIQELLSDTGLGQQMHVIVGQGRLDTILKADPSGHRAFIEEAAGILKHRKRKERALRKLANTETNLARLDDLLREIRRQLGPLGRQARISKRAESIQISLRDAQSRLYADDAVQSMRQREALRNKLTSVRSELGDAQQELSRVKVQIEQLEALSAQSSPALMHINQNWHELSRIQERLRSLASLAEERSRSLMSQLVTANGEDPELLNKRAAELEALAAEQRGVVEETRLQLDKATEQRADDEKKLASVRQTITQLRRTAQQRESKIASLREMIAREESAVQLADSRCKDFATQRASVEQRRTDAANRRAELEAHTQHDLADDGSAALDEARNYLATVVDELNELQDAQRELNGKVISLKAKADALNDTLESRNASSALDEDEKVAAWGHLADFIHVREGWEEAIAHALSVFASAVVVPSAGNMRHALERAREDRLGRAVLLMPTEPMSDDITTTQVNDADDNSDDLAYSDNANATADASNTASTTADAATVADTLIEDVVDTVIDGTVAGVIPAAELVQVNPAAADVMQARGVVQSVRLLLNNVAAVQTLDQAMAVTGVNRDVTNSVAADPATAHPTDTDFQSSYAGKQRFTQAVTQAGEIVGVVGAVGGSSLSQSDLSLAARRDKALERMRDLQTQLDALDNKVNQARVLRDQSRAAVDQAATRRTEAKLRAEQAAQSLRAAEADIASLDKQLRSLDDRIATARDDAESHRLTTENLHRALDAAQSSDDGNADFEELTRREHDLEISLNTTREQEVAAKIAWTEAGRKADSYARQSGLLHDQAKEAVERRTRIEAMNVQRRKQATHADQIAQDATQVAQLVAQAINDVTVRRERLQEEASSHDEELKNLRTQRNTIEPKVAALQRREHELDVDRERLAGEYGQITQKISDDLGMRVDELVQGWGPELPVPVLDDEGQPIPLDTHDQTRSAARNTADDSTKSANTTDTKIADASTASASADIATTDTTVNAQGTTVSTQGITTVNTTTSTASHEQAWQTVPYNREEQRKRLEKAKRDLAALGKVNPLAAEEYDALQARNQYLNDQRDDVTKSRDDLMQLIKDLDSTMVSVFQAAFNDTAAAFEKMFATLFPGGTGRLRLENPNDMLTTGVIVEASPAGKRVKQLSLLSGGERSLTALALLFAIFTARPSPFYVMDEVEAALDDVNLTRLINAFNELRAHAQLIVITHQQRTMSIADALYGVSMRSDGVTAVVSQRLGRV